MSKVHITQCLCPDRHCIMAIVWKEPDFTPETAIRKLEGIVSDMIAKKTLNPWCGLCNSRTLKCEDGVTRFKTIEEAMPVIKRVELMQQVGRSFIEAATAYKRN